RQLGAAVPSFEVHGPAGTEAEGLGLYRVGLAGLDQGDAVVTIAHVIREVHDLGCGDALPEFPDTALLTEVLEHEVVAAALGADGHDDLGDGIRVPPPDASRESDPATDVELRAHRGDECTQLL